MTAADRRALERIVKLAARIIGRDLTPISEIYRSRVENKACAIINDEFHPPNELFELLRAGKRYRVIKCNTERFRRSFYPTAVRGLNYEVICNLLFWGSLGKLLQIKVL